MTDPLNHQEGEKKRSHFLKYFSNLHYKNIMGMFLINFFAGRSINGINTFSGFDIGSSLPFPIIFTTIPYLITLIPVLLIWMFQKRFWNEYYIFAWFIWAVLLVFYVWGNSLSQ
ncbi:MAG: hypothetical protein C0433_14415 [Cyclobacterium sp.]|nr:hypothetical protein [Cyclobacterium sp.]